MCFCAVAAFISILGFLSPQLSTVLSIAMAVFLILRADPAGLPALSILWIQAIEFTKGAVPGPDDLPGAVWLFGFPLTLPLVALAALTARVLWESVRRQETFARTRRQKIMLFLWLLLFTVTVISAALGKGAGNSNWTQPLRVSMALGCLFYGLIIARAMENKLWVLTWLFRVALFVLLLMFASLYWSHIGFFYVALGATSVLLMVQQKRWLLAMLSSTPVLIVSRGGDTLTMLALILFGLLIGLFFLKSGIWLNRKIFSVGTALIFPLGLLMVVAVLFVPLATPVGYVSRDADLLSRFIFKLYADRGPLWDAAWKLATSDFSLIIPSGSSLRVESSIINATKELWNIHIHNSFLEMLRQTGFLGAALFLVLFPILWFRLRTALLQPLPLEIRVFGGAALVASAVGSITGIFPFDFSAGPWIWLFAGITIGFSPAKGPPEAATAETSGLRPPITTCLPLDA